MARPQMLPVKSSNVGSVGYDPYASELHVTFKDNPWIYAHANVPQAVFLRFFTAPSKGKYYAEQIKGKFKFSKLRPIPPQL
jgi:hypothetical protein